MVLYKQRRGYYTLLPVREEAGLGSPPEPFYTNSSECMNNVLKVKVDYKRTELSAFIDKLHLLVDDQQREGEKAVVGCGKYFLQPQYHELRVPQSKWFTMNKEQRKRWLKKLNEMSVLPPGDSPVTLHSALTVHFQQLMLLQCRLLQTLRQVQVFTLARNLFPSQYRQ